jgi:hypothetical protein
VQEQIYKVVIVHKRFKVALGQPAPAATCVSVARFEQPGATGGMQIAP